MVFAGCAVPFWDIMQPDADALFTSPACVDILDIMKGPTNPATAAATFTYTPTATATTAATPTAMPTQTPQDLESVEYIYDGDNNLVKSVIETTEGIFEITETTYYVGRIYEKVVVETYDTNTQLTETITTERRYYFVGSTRIAMRTKEGETETLNWLLGDHLGSTSVTTDANGAFLSEMRYTAFGEVWYTFNTTPTNYLYTGQLSQEEIGLYYYVARFYDPYLNHFSQPDSIIPEPGKAIGYDRFAYANNNPIRYTDPSGHYAQTQWGTGGGGGDQSNEPMDSTITPTLPITVFQTLTAIPNPVTLPGMTLSTPMPSPTAGFVGLMGFGDSESYRANATVFEELIPVSVPLNLTYQANFSIGDTSKGQMLSIFEIYETDFSIADNSAASLDVHNFSPTLILSWSNGTNSEFPLGPISESGERSNTFPLKQNGLDILSVQINIIPNASPASGIRLDHTNKKYFEYKIKNMNWKH